MHGTSMLLLFILSISSMCTGTLTQSETPVNIPALTASSSSSSNQDVETNYTENGILESNLCPTDPSDLGETGTQSFSESGSTEHRIPSDQELLETGQYIDGQLIRYVGSSEFEAWLRGNPDGTVYEFTAYFNITDEKVKELTADHIYEAYMKYKP